MLYHTGLGAVVHWGGFVLAAAGFGMAVLARSATQAQKRNGRFMMVGGGLLIIAARAWL